MRCYDVCSAGFGECLLDLPTSTKFVMKADYPQQAGKVYTADTQCELVFGEDSKRCPYMVSSRSPGSVACFLSLYLLLYHIIST